MKNSTCLPAEAFSTAKVLTMARAKAGLSLLLLCFTLGIAAQTNSIERRPGEVIVQLEPGEKIQTILSELSQDASAGFTLKDNLSPEWGIFLFQFAETADNRQEMLAALRRIKGIHSAQWNHKVQERSREPNDPDWWRQGDMTLINAPSVWDASTGGLTPNGDTIVVAVLEKGALLTHPDLAPNRWWNWHEIPGNGIDDDANGYKDDFGGWNPQTQADDTGNKGFHGTAVHGIVGAKGNNSLGVTGVNWDVKLMNISGMDYESEIIQGYQYVGKLRRIYNQTNGAKGAFVVATNASFGFDFERAEDHPIWCALYDSLGKVGILSVGATINQNVDVDVQGDMPTTCPSEYFIAVTNTTKSGAKVAGAGYGALSIDLGAPGSDTYSTYNSGTQTNPVPSYSTIGGCSAAAPHVTGGIALLYSLDCEPFTNDAVTQPATCARRVRDMILNNTQAQASLAGITTTGGHLDLGKSLAGVRALCLGDSVGHEPVLALDSIKIILNDNFIRVFYQVPNFQPNFYTFRVYNMLGQPMRVYNIRGTPVNEKQLTPDQFNKNYEDLDITFLPRGVYVLAIGHGKKVTAARFRKI